MTTSVYIVSEQTLGKGYQKSKFEEKNRPTYNLAAIIGLLYK